MTGRSDRAVSTAVDVIVAMLVLSGAITMIFLYTASSSSPAPPEQQKSDEIAELLATTTVQINYSVTTSLGDSSNTYNFTETGTLAHHLKRATLLNASFRENKGSEGLSYAVPCNRVVTDYQGEVIDSEKGLKDTDDYYANGRRYPAGAGSNRDFYLDDGRIKPEYRKYRFTGLKDKFINDTKVAKLKDEYVNSSGEMKERYLNDDGTVRMEHQKNLSRSDFTSVECYPTGEISSTVLEDYNNVESVPDDDGPSSEDFTQRQIVETNYQEKIRSKLHQTLRTNTENYRIETTWQPYQRPDDIRPYMSSRVTVGRQPDRDREISSSRLTVPSGMATAEEVRSRDRRGGTEQSIAAAVIEGYLPKEETRFEAERGQLSQAYAKDRYLKFGQILGTGTRQRVAARVGTAVTTGYSLETTTLNEILVNLLAHKMYNQDIAEMDTENVRERITTGQVDIVVKTW